MTTIPKTTPAAIVCILHIVDVYNIVGFVFDDCGSLGNILSYNLIKDSVFILNENKSISAGEDFAAVLVIIDAFKMRYKVFDFLAVNSRIFDCDIACCYELPML